MAAYGWPLELGSADATDEEIADRHMEQDTPYYATQLLATSMLHTNTPMADKLLNSCYDKIISITLWKVRYR